MKYWTEIMELKNTAWGKVLAIFMAVVFAMSTLSLTAFAYGTSEGEPEDGGENTAVVVQAATTDADEGFESVEDIDEEDPESEDGVEEEENEELDANEEDGLTPMAEEDGEPVEDDAVTDGVAQIGETKYATLKEAVGAAESGATIVMVADITDMTAADIVTVPAGKAITLDMAGHSITVSSDFAGRPISNQGTLTVTGNGTIDSTNGASGYGAIRNDGTLTIMNGNFIGNVYGDGSAIRNGNGSKLTVHDGYFAGTSAIYNAGEATIYKGKFETLACSACGTPWAYALNNRDEGGISGKMWILPASDGDVVVHGTQGALAAAGGAKVVVDGGTFYTHPCGNGHTGSTFYALYVSGKEGMDAATCVINGGKFSTKGANACMYLVNENPSDNGGNPGEAVVQINGGSFDQGLAQKLINFNSKPGGVLEIAGGEFAGSDIESVLPYITSGSMLQDMGDGTYSVVEKDNAAKIGETKYETLAAAIKAANDGDVIELLQDVTVDETYSSNTSLEIRKALTIDGQGHTITCGKKFGIRIFGTAEDADTMKVVLKNVVVTNANTLGRAVETRGGNVELVLDNAMLTTTGSGNTQVLTVGGNRSNATTVTIENGSQLIASQAGYGILTFNPVDMTIDNSSVSGYGAIYLKGPDSSAGSAGSTINIVNGANINSAGIAGPSNSFGTLVFQTEDIEVNVIDSTLVATADPSNDPETPQAVILYSSWADVEGVVVNISGSSQVTTVNESAVFVRGTEDGNTISVSGGSFSDDVSEYCVDGYGVAKPEGSDTYAVHEHDLTSVVTKAATCSAEGEMTTSCTVDGCAHEIVDSVAIDPNAHEFGEWVVTTPAAAGVAGEQRRECVHNSTHFETQVIAALPANPQVNPGNQGGTTGNGDQQQGNQTGNQAGNQQQGNQGANQGGNQGAGQGGNQGGNQGGGQGGNQGINQAGGQQPGGETITDNENPLAAPADETIDDNANPLAAPTYSKQAVEQEDAAGWMFPVVLVIGIMLIAGLFFLIAKKRKKDKENPRLRLR